jgi:hypothetical protein
VGSGQGRNPGRQKPGPLLVGLDIRGRREERSGTKVHADDRGAAGQAKGDPVLRLFQIGLGGRR